MTNEFINLYDRFEEYPPGFLVLDNSGEGVMPDAVHNSQLHPGPIFPFKKAWRMAAIFVLLALLCGTLLLPGRSSTANSSIVRATLDRTFLSVSFRSNLSTVQELGDDAACFVADNFWASIGTQPESAKDRATKKQTVQSFQPT